MNLFTGFGEALWKNTNDYMKTPGLCTLALLWFSTVGVAQTANPGRMTVSLDYSGVALATVLAEMEREYGLYFAYSRDHLEMDYPISVLVEKVPLEAALEEMFKDTPIVFAIIGGQILLRADHTKAEDRMGAVEYKPEKSKSKLPPNTPKPVEWKTPPENIAAKVEPTNTKVEPLAKIQPTGRTTLRYDFEREHERLLFLDSLNVGRPADHQVAQISVFPGIGTNAKDAPEITNNLSLNLFWGKNGGVEGVEFGGLVNRVEGDVDGFQFAGLGNSVAGTVRGTQFAGLFNLARERVTGIQYAGLVNVSNEANALQVAGLANLSEDALNGLQFAGVFNKAGVAGRAGWQFAGLFNTNYGKSQLQVSGLFNVGKAVDYAQIAGVMNVAESVKGVQIGLINITDTVGGATIGLLNIVRKGYNKVDLVFEDGITAGVGLKLGSQRFYNIFQFGLRWEDSFFPKFSQGWEAFTHWTAGYGIGSAFYLSKRKRWMMNLELLTSQVNEGRNWNTQLNLLNQFRWTVDFRLFGGVRVFGGPTLNVLVSEHRNPDTGLLGSGIAPADTWLDRETPNLRTQLWPGFSAGIRF